MSTRCFGNDTIKIREKNEASKHLKTFVLYSKLKYLQNLTQNCVHDEFLSNQNAQNYAKFIIISYVHV